MSSSRNAPRVAVVDVDGTLVDTDYQHALAWYRAFRSLEETFPIWRIHRLNGMGGDQLVAEICPDAGGRAPTPQACRAPSGAALRRDGR